MVPTLYNASGRPIMLGRLASELNDYIVTRIGKTIINVDPVLLAEGGSGPTAIQIYETLLRDDQVASTLQTRKLAVTGKEWAVEPASDNPKDVEIAEFIERAFKAFDMDSARASLMDAIVIGYKVAEVIWEYYDGMVWVKRIIPVPSRRIVFDENHKARLLTANNMLDGEELPDRKFIIYRNKDPNGSPYGYGLGRALYWPVWFKKNGIKFWAIFLEKFGSPTVIGRYPSGASEDIQNTLMDALQSIQTDAVIRVPEGMTIELLEAMRTGKADTYGEFVDRWDRQISKVILGHGASADATPGKLGNEDRANAVADDYLKADADMMSLCINETLVKWLVDLNYGPQKEYPKYWIRTDDEPNLKPLAERDKILSIDIGLPMTRQYFYETYGIPQPTSNSEDELVNAPKPEPAVPGIGTKQNAPRGKEPNSKDTYFAEHFKVLYPDQEALEHLVDSITPQDMQAQANGLLKPLIEMVQAGTSHVEVLTELAKAFPSMDAGGLQKILATALYYADILGAVSAREER